MLARHANSLLVTLLAVLPAAASEPLVEQKLNACGCAAIVCLADGDAWAGCDASCHEPCCPICCDDRPYDWHIQVEALALSRTAARNRPLVVSASSGETALAASDLDLGYQLGPRILIGRPINPDRDWELSYFGLHEWHAARVVEDENNLDIAGTLAGLADDYSGADRFALRQSARLHNAEANLMAHRGCWSALAGLRYFHMNEEVVLTATDSDSGTSDYTARSQSDLIGFQLGLRRGGGGIRWGWELTAKAGLYCSMMQQQQLLLDNDNSFVLRNGSAREGSAAFLGDINFVGFRQLNDVWSLRSGYFVMYVNGVALAADQLDFNSLATSGQQISRGDLFLHGASLGLEARW